MRLNDIGACAPPAVPREAVRLLQTLIAGADMTPQPDGTTRFAFECTDEFVDRLALWNLSVQAAEAGGAVPDGGAPEADPADIEALHNVVAPDGLAHIHAVRTSAREALALLHADIAGAELPALTPRPLAERMALRGEALSDELAPRAAVRSPL